MNLPPHILTFDKKDLSLLTVNFPGTMLHDMPLHKKVVECSSNVVGCSRVTGNIFVTHY